MNLFYNMTTTANTTIDKAVSQIETHEAIVNAIVNECHKLSNKAQIQYKRIKKDSDLLNNKLYELKKIEKSWEKNICKTPNADNIEREEVQQCNEQIQIVENILDSHYQLESSLIKEIYNIEARVLSLTKNSAPSIHTPLGAAMHVVNAIEKASETNMDDVLSHWDITLTKAPYIDDTQVN